MNAPTADACEICATPNPSTTTTTTAPSPPDNFSTATTPEIASPVSSPKHSDIYGYSTEHFVRPDSRGTNDYLFTIVCFYFFPVVWIIACLQLCDFLFYCEPEF
jgi:hypothetical protein